MSAFSLLISPVFLTKYLHRIQNVLLPNIFKYIPTASVIDLSSVTFSVILSSTSELLRFLERMAASKPTSWLSLLMKIISLRYHLFPLNLCLGTLACDLGFFPLDFGPLRPKSVCFLVCFIHNIVFGIRSFHKLGIALGNPYPESALPPNTFSKNALPK